MGIIPSKKKRKQIIRNEEIKKPHYQNTEEYLSWVNLGFELFKERIGEKVFEKKMAEADEPPPKAGPFSVSQLTLYAKKYRTKFTLRSLVTQNRGQYPVSVGAIGNATVVSNPLLPDHEFFTAGHVFPVRLRHNNLVRPDDAQLDIRVVSMKFADNDLDSPFDVILHTGKEAAFWNIVSFDKVLTAMAGGTDALEKFCLEDPWHYHLMVAAFRRAPDSFTDQRYHSWMVFEYTAKDEVPRYGKFRLIPADERQETGLMTEDDQRRPWEYSRWKEERRSENYLSFEFQDRLLQQSIKYKLQIQLHKIKSGDSHLILHPARSWDQGTHPWLDLADVTLTSLLPCDVLQDTRCSVQNSPPTITIPPAKTIYDYNSIAFLSTKVYGFLQRKSSIQTLCSNVQDQSIYCISVRTGDRKRAGTDAMVSLTITGTTGRTKPLSLDKWLHDDFEAGQEDTYFLDAEDVGDLLLIKLENDQGGLFSDWFVDTVLITCSQNPQKLFEFPCFRWVQREAVIFEGGAKVITDDQHDVVKSHRRLEIQQRQELYHWGDDAKYSGLPGFIKAESSKRLPKDVQSTQEAADDQHEVRHKTLINLGLIKLLNIFDSWEDFEDYRKTFVSYVGDVPSASDRWQDDRFYGAQFLNGCNPEMIRRCTELPPNFPVTQGIVGNLLDEGDALHKAMLNGRLYVVDYKILEDVPHCGQNDGVERRHTCASMGLFYIRHTGDMVPLAIQLHQVPSETNPIWTPNDSEMDWIFAKMWLRNADAQWHQVITHFLRCHLFMEPVAVASWRQLPSLHPLWKLLVPHIRGILAINTLARQRLIPAGGVADNTLSVGSAGQLVLMEKYYKDMSWSSYDLPSTLKKRGVIDAEKLPNFYYRDDALQLWRAIQEYVSSILNIYYHSDNCIVEDTELQSWIRDLHDNGYPIRDGEADHGFPSSVTSKEQLNHILTIIIFTCSCQHAAVNFSQMDVFGFLPNSPSLMRQPPPTKKGVVTMKEIMKCLPTKHQAGVIIATMYDLTRIFPDERFLGDYSEGQFIEAAPREAILRFQERLGKISAAIRMRNKSLELPYYYLLPERTPNSVAV